MEGHFPIENTPLRIDTILSVGSKAKLRNYLKSREGVDLKSDPAFEKAFEGVGGLTFPCTGSDVGSFVVVWMPSFDWSVRDVETLSHECLHASVMVMRMSGQKPRIFSPKDDEEVDDEGLAYRQSSMLAGMLCALAKKQQRNFRKSTPDPGDKGGRRGRSCMKS